MKHILTTIIIFLSFFSYGQDSTQNIKTFDLKKYIQSTIGKQFGQFKIKTSDKTLFSNSNLADKVVFVNFWFESCVPCISELAGFNKLFDTLKDNKNFMFISFTFDPDSSIQKLKNKYHIKYKVFHIDRAECYRLNFNMGFPTNFILDRKAVIKYSTVGGQVDIEKSTEDVMTKIYPKIIEQF
jgi:cytochrome c biogenesis protein CcmG/thiol:disulfide interchange protein DsbE